MRKLTTEQVQEIREKFATGKYLTRTLAPEYGVTSQNIWWILSGKSWIEGYDPELKKRNRALLVEHRSYGNPGPQRGRAFTKTDRARVLLEYEAKTLARKKHKHRLQAEYRGYDDPSHIEPTKLPDYVEDEDV